MMDGMKIDLQRMNPSEYLKQISLIIYVIFIIFILDYFEEIDAE